MDVKPAIEAIIAAHKAVPLVNKPTDTVEAGELLNARTETMKVFDAGNGQRRAHIYGCPIHYKDTDGSFKSIDPTVKRKPLADDLQTHKYETKSGLYHAHFKDTKPWDYRLEIGDSWIEYEAQFSESVVLTIDVQTSRIGVKETITLKDKTAPTRLSWKVTRSGNGIITPPPIAVDADGKPMVVKVSQDGDILTYDVDTTGVVFPVMVDPTTSVVATNDGTLNMASSATYENVRNASTADGITTTDFSMGQRYNAGLYRTWRGFASFEIPNITGLITASSLFLYGLADNSVVDFEMYIHTSTYSDPLIVADFDQFDGWQASGAYNGTVLNDVWNSSSYSATWNEITFNAAGRAAILAMKNDTFKMAAISKEEYDNSAPTDWEYCHFETSSSAGKEPYLSITYTIAVVEAISALVEMEAGIPSLMKSPLSALLEIEATVAEIKAMTEAVSALIEMEASVLEIKAQIEAVSALLEVEATVAEIKAMTEAVSALLEMEASVTGFLTYFLSLGGSVTPSGGLTSLSNPDWIAIDDRLRWMGEWIATRVYDVGDVVMYKTEEGRYHGWLSRTTHNVGNIPTTSYAHWARIVQAKWKR